MNNTIGDTSSLLFLYFYPAWKQARFGGKADTLICFYACVTDTYFIYPLLLSARKICLGWNMGSLLGSLGRLWKGRSKIIYP